MMGRGEFLEAEPGFLGEEKNISFFLYVRIRCSISCYQENCPDNHCDANKGVININGYI